MKEPTRTVPTDPGFYWWRHGGCPGTGWSLVKVLRRQTGVYMLFIGCQSAIDMTDWPDSEWVGPIEEPPQ